MLIALTRFDLSKRVGAFACAALLSLAAMPGRADSVVARGRTLVEANCTRCHAVGLKDKSPHPDAPAFRTLSSRYPVEDLAEALAEGISTGHPDMPEFVASPDQIDAIIAYLRSLQSR
jgi:mono/diheme cytochrome c family protein